METVFSNRSRKLPEFLPASVAVLAFALLSLVVFLLIIFSRLSRTKEHLDNRMTRNIQAIELLGSARSIFNLLASRGLTGPPATPAQIAGLSAQVRADFETLGRLSLPWTPQEKHLVAQGKSAWKTLFARLETSGGGPAFSSVSRIGPLKDRLLIQILTKSLLRTEKKRLPLIRTIGRIEGGILAASFAGFILTVLAAWLFLKTSRAFASQKNLSDVLRKIDRLLESETCDDLSVLFGKVARELSRSMDLPLVAIAFVLPEEDTLRFLGVAGTASGFAEEITFRVAPGEKSLTESARKSGTPQLAEDLATDPRFSSWQERARDFGLRSAVVDATPTKDGDLMVLALFREHPGGFSEEALPLVSGLLRTLVACSDRRNTESERLLLVSCHEALAEIHQALLRSKNAGEMFGEVARTLVTKTDLAGIQIHVPEEGTEFLRLEASGGKTPDLALGSKTVRASKRSTTPVFGESVTSRAFQAGKIVGPAVVSTDPTMKKLLALIPSLNEVKSIMAYPVLIPEREEPAAVLTVWIGVLRHFTPELQLLLAQLAQSLSLAIERLDRTRQIEFFSLAAQNTTDGIIITDSDTRVRWVNRAFEEKYGFSQKEILGRRPLDFRTGPETDLQALDRVRMLETQGLSFSETFRVYSRNGEPCWIFVNATSLRSPDGSHTGYVGIETDVTALKELEERSRRVSLLYQALSETTAALEEPSSSTTEERIAGTLSRLSALLGFRFLLLGTISESRTNLRILAGTGPDPLGFEALLNDPQDKTAGDFLKNPRSGRLSDLSLPQSLRERALSRGFSGMIAAPAPRVSGETLLLAGFFEEASLLHLETAPLFEKISDAIAGFLDKAERAKTAKIERARDLQLEAQREILSARDEERVYRILADTVSSEPGVLFANVRIPEGESLKSCAMMGPLSPFIAHLPPAPLTLPDPGMPCPFPTRIYHARTPLRIHRPGEDPAMDVLWRTHPLDAAGIAAGWPIHGPDPGAPPVAVLTVAIDRTYGDGFSDNILYALIDDLTESASLAIDRIRAHRKMENLSLLDPLTGLLNRRGLDIFLGEFLKTLHRRSGVGILAVLDLDRFKPVNDTWGHAAGDMLLMELGRRMKAFVRDSDLVARLGGDEFAIAMNLSSLGDLPSIMERMHPVIEAPYFLPNGPDEGVLIALSMGIAPYPEAGEDPDLLVQRADSALYAVKNAKGNRDRWWALWSAPS